MFSFFQSKKTKTEGSKKKKGGAGKKRRTSVTKPASPPTVSEPGPRYYCGPAHTYIEASKHMCT